MADEKTNGLVRKALDLLKRRRPPAKRIGFNSEETGLLRKAGKELLRSLTDEELNQELERRERDRLLDYGLAAKRNEKPKRPDTPFDQKIRDRTQREKELKTALNAKREAFFAAKDELRAARKAHPSDLDAEERAERKVDDARFEFERSEQDWKRCRSGRRALKMARSRWIGEREYLRGLKATGRI